MPRIEIGTSMDGRMRSHGDARAGLGGAIGAVIGAIAGGGQGAAIGGAVGAGAGAGSVFIRAGVISISRTARNSGPEQASHVDECRQSHCGGIWDGRQRWQEGQGKEPATASEQTEARRPEEAG